MTQALGDMPVDAAGRRHCRRWWIGIHLDLDRQALSGVRRQLRRPEETRKAQPERVDDAAVSKGGNDFVSLTTEQTHDSREPAFGVVAGTVAFESEVDVFRVTGEIEEET